MGYIKQTSIDKIMDIVRIEEVVGDYVKLKKAGANMSGLCPFHNEKTPSFVVSPAKGIYKCFGCGEAGNAVNFLMNVDGLTYPEAIRTIAKQYRIELEEEETSEAVEIARDEREIMFAIHQFAGDFFQKAMSESDYGRSVGLSYFKQRGFSDKVIEKFGLGFSGSEGHSLMQAALNAGYSKEQLETCGLIKNDRDFFRNRVMFSISNSSGKTIAFAGRILDTTTKAPKYLNSPETPIYTKSQVLYGMFQARKAIKQKDECLLVEGYTDVLSLHQAGVENVVASSGTSLTDGQVSVIKRFTNQITILYDGDAAGIKAALRGVDLILSQDVNVRVVVLPEKEDPDSYIQAVGTEAFETYIREKSEDVVMFKTNLLMREAGADPVKKAGVVKDVLSSVSKIPDRLKQVEYIKVCAELFDMPQQVLLTELHKITGNQSKRLQAPVSVPKSSSKPAVQPKFSFEQDLVRVLLLFGQQSMEEEQCTIAEYILAEVEDILDEFDDVHCQDIIKEYYDALLNEKHLALKHFTNHSDKDIQYLAIELAADKYVYSENWSNRFGIELTTQKMPELNFDADARKALHYFKLSKIKVLLEKVDEKLINGEGDELENIKIKMHLLEIRKQLALSLGSVVF